MLVTVAQKEGDLGVKHAFSASQHYKKKKKRHVLISYQPFSLLNSL